MVSGAAAAVSVRQHDIHLSGGPPSEWLGNAVEGRVVRNVFLGAARDYVVEAKDGTQLRVTAEGRARASSPARSCGLTLPPDRCRALEG